jgi:hypothetical protein
VAGALLSDLIAVPERAALCGSVTARARLVFPYWMFVVVEAFVPNACLSKFGAWHKRRYNNLASLARARRTARFCKCFRKRSSSAGILSTLLFCQRCWIKF